MKNVIGAKHVLHAIALYEPESLTLEIDDIIDCIVEGKQSETFPDLSSNQLRILVSEFVKESKESLLVEKILKDKANEKSVRHYIRNILST